MASTTTAPQVGAAAAAARSSNQHIQQKNDRVAAHTHVLNLGLDDETGEVLLDDSSSSSCGLIGQVAARQACGLVVDLIQTQKLAGRALLLVGPPGTGKTALALALAKQVGKHVPFLPMVASQVYSKEVKKTEILTQQFRKAIGLRIREHKEVYEGEVTELTCEETEDPLQRGGGGGAYGRSLSHVIVGLKTTKGTKTLKLDPTMYDALTKEHVTVGDVIYIEANSGAVKRVGRSDSFATEFDLEAEEYVPLPKGDVHKKRQVVQDVSLHDLDVANAQPKSGSGGKDVQSLLQALQKPRQTEITDKLREEINKVVEQYVKDGIAELVPGVLFIDEVHMLDLECFTYLNRQLESRMAPPMVVLATNRGLTKVRGTKDVIAPHGIPVDFLDRLLIVPTLPYSQDEMRQIVAIRAKTEHLQVSNEALQALAKIGVQASLRYALQLLTPAHVLAETVGRQEVRVEDVEQVDALFLHAKASAQMLQSSEYME